MPRVLTAPLAIIRQEGIAIGKMRGLRGNENYQRGRVQGIGKTNADELPLLSFAGTLTCDFYAIDFRNSQIPKAVFRSVQTNQGYFDTLLLQELGIQLDIYKKVRTDGATTGIPISIEEQPWAIITGLFIDGDSFDINEGQVSGRNQSFQFIDPIIFPT